MKKLFERMLKSFKQMSEPFEQMLQYFERMLTYFKRTCKPFERFVECFEWIFLGIRTDDKWITNGLPVFEQITVSIHFAFHSHN